MRIAPAQGIAVFAPTFRSLHKAAGLCAPPFPGQPASVRDAPGSIPGGAAKITSCFLSLSFAPAYALPTDLGDGKKTRE
jgi:hypothetical protein